MTSLAIKEVQDVFTADDCRRILKKRYDCSFRDGRLRDYLVYRDQNDPYWSEEFELIWQRLCPLIEEYSTTFFNLIPVEATSISHIGFLNDEHGEFTELHYDWDYVRVEKGAREIIKPFVVLIYLSNIAEGGELLFPLQSVKITPQIGKVVFFPCNYSYPHVAMPVLEGSKHVCRVTVKLDPQIFYVDELEI
jgi:hypothetical protein